VFFPGVESLSQPFWVIFLVSKPEAQNSIQMIFGFQTQLFLFLFFRFVTTSLGDVFST